MPSRVEKDNIGTGKTVSHSYPIIYHETMQPKCQPAIGFILCTKTTKSSAYNSSTGLAVRLYSLLKEVYANR